MPEEQDEFDNLPGDLANLEGIDWDNVLPVPVSTQDVAVALRQSPPQPSTRSSSHFSGDDYMDTAFLTELDAVERRATIALRASLPQMIPDAAENRPCVKQVQESRYKRPRSRSSSSVNDRPHFSPRKKGKTKALNVLEILAEFDEELTCPICSEFFVAAQVGNPCGHTFCGDCGWCWIVKNKKPGCPVCRTKLSRSRSMIPNITLDNLVEKHLVALALNGDESWKDGGIKFKEWHARKSRWKEGSANRAEKKKPPRKTINIVDPWTVVDNEDDDPTYLDDDEQLIPVAYTHTDRRTSRRG